jgi:hypothetical protein
VPVRGHHFGGWGDDDRGGGWRDRDDGHRHHGDR